MPADTSMILYVFESLNLGFGKLAMSESSGLNCYVISLIYSASGKYLVVALPSN